MRLDLPTFIDSLAVVGVTKGSPRWTVYFRNGARFTQMYRSPDNLGYHPPEPHFFFGNVDETPITDKQKELEKKYPENGAAMMLEYSEFLCSYAKGNILLNKKVRPTVPKQNELTSHKRLLEVKGSQSKLIGHNSRAALEPLTIVEARQLIAEIRGRSSNITQCIETGDYYFEEQGG